MKRIKALGLCLVAVFALAAITASLATAKKVHNTGPVPQTASGGVAKLEGSPLPPIECKKQHSTSELLTGTTDKAQVFYEECESNGKKCQNVGGTPGHITTNPLSTEVGWISKSKGEVGDDFKPASGTYLAEFECEGIVVKVKGSVIAKVSPTNTMSTTGKVIAKEEGGKQSPEKFESGPKDTLITEASAVPGSEIQSTQEQEDVVTNTPFSTTKGKKTTETADPSEVSTVEVVEGEEEVEGKKGKKEKVKTYKTATRAQPKFGRCQEAKGGKYADSNCTQAAELKKGKSKGKYEFEEV
jgi:hypothetical protein